MLNETPLHHLTTLVQIKVSIKKAQGSIMNFIEQEISEGIATLILSRGKVNAIIGEVVAELNNVLNIMEKESLVKAIVLTGHGKFFSFGFDIPHFLSYTKKEFYNFLIQFTKLYTYMFMYPKPVVAALNGHTIAGGCMLALACDKRLMVKENCKISLNEIGFGSTVFAGCTEMLRFRVGNNNATNILYSGKMYQAEEALSLGIIDKITSEEDLRKQSMEIALELGGKSNPAFNSIKSLLRKSIAQEMIKNENHSIERFIDLWYSDITWENIKKIKIH